MAMTDYGGYEGQRRDVSYRHDTDAMNNAYGRFISQQRGSRQLGDMHRNFSRQTPSHNAGYGRRGLAGAGTQSGVQQRGMQNWYGDYGREYGRTQQDLTEGLRQYDRQQMSSTAYRDQALRDIDMAQTNEMANAAQNLEWLKQMIGAL